MESWVTIFMALGGLVVFVATPLLKLNSTMTRTNVILENLEKKDLEHENKIENLTDGYNDHERRIDFIERTGFTKIREK